MLGAFNTAAVLDIVSDGSNCEDMRRAEVRRQVRRAATSWAWKCVALALLQLFSSLQEPVHLGPLLGYSFNSGKEN